MTLNILRHSEGFIPKHRRLVFTQQNDFLQIDSSGAVVLDFRVVDFLDYTFRLRLCRSVENLLLTSSLALLDSTLPKIRQNDGKGVRHTEALAEVSFFCKGNLRQQRPKNLFCEDCIDYIHFNPVKHGYVKLAKDWQYSTFLRYVKQGFYDENWCDFSQDRDLYE